MFTPATPILTLKIQGRFVGGIGRGVTVICDDRNNPPEVVDDNVVIADLYKETPSEDEFGKLQAAIRDAVVNFVRGLQV